MRTLLPFAFTLFALACGRNASRPEAATAPTPSETIAEERFAKSEMTDHGGAAPMPLPVDRKIIRTGSLTYEVDDLDAARSTVLERAKAEGGYVEGDDRGEWGNVRSVTLRVRIPADRFDAFLGGIGNLGRLENRSISATYVTTEWVDVEARLAAKRAVEKRYLELAAQAKSVEEMLQVERELGNVRAEIESMEARIKGLRDQVAMSSLTITCQKRVATTERFTPRFGVALKEGWSNLLRFLVRLAELWPFVLLAAGMSWWWRKRRGRGSKQA